MRWLRVSGRGVRLTATDHTRSFRLWGVEIPGISEAEIRYLERFQADLPPPLYRLWEEMDRVWCSLGLDNRVPLMSQPIAQFYDHPVWVASGLFTAVDQESVGHRRAIAAHIASEDCSLVADVGGGFGELALMITRHTVRTEVQIVEPFPSVVGRYRLRNVDRIRFVDDYVGDYDAVIAQDVLEHVSDPIGMAIRMAESTRIGGQLIFANCFYPVILCHLPGHFHLRHTFPFVLRGMGLRYEGTVHGAPHAQRFRKVGPLRLPEARRRERWSKSIGPVINHLAPIWFPLLKRLSLR
jgi:hypothetical protein